MGMKKLKFLPICTQQPRTTSLRMKKVDNDIYKTINSVYFDSGEPGDDSVETPESWFTNSAESFSTTSSSGSAILGDSSSDVEAVIRGAQQSSNQRFFFEPGPGESSSLVVGGGGGHVTVAVESEDPHVDFKRSMAEMVASLGVRWDDFDGLKELLGCYLKVNEESNHGFILGAFVDLISGINNNNNVTSSSNNNNNNNNNSKTITEDEESASFTTAAATSLSRLSSLASAAASARLLLGEDIQIIHD